MVGAGISMPAWASPLEVLTSGTEGQAGSEVNKPYGSGHFGEWVVDEFGLPAYRYTCNQTVDPAAVTPVHTEWRSPTDHTHQVGNDRLVVAVSNYGYVQVRQDEGSPKFLNDYSPKESRYGAGIGFLTDGQQVLSTYYPGNGASFDRILGEGYIRKTVTNPHYEVEHTIVAPYGDDPVVLSMVKVTNRGSSAADLRWVEYWGAQNYQFSYRSGMEAGRLGDNPKGAALRRAFAARFVHKFSHMQNGSGLLETQSFLGRTAEEETLWQQIEAGMKNPNGPYGGHLHEVAPGAVWEDLNPPSTFLVSLDAAPDGYSTDGGSFFGTGGVENPSGLATPLGSDLSASGPASAFLLERKLHLQPGESKSLYFLYGYVPEGFEAEELVKKYSADPAGILAGAAAQWKNEGLHFSVPSEPWVEREISWHNYYLRSSITWDSFFREHIISQGHVYQYVMGFQGAARDPLQHTLPFVFSDPGIVKGIIRYTLKEIQPDGSIPYALVGSGMPMPSAFDPGDQEMWLLWAASEYVLAARDHNFLDEKITPYMDREPLPTDPTVRDLLARAFTHLVTEIGTGKHGLMRLAMGDWNDGIVVGRVPEKYDNEVHQQAESVLNAAMASYVLDYYGRMLNSVGEKEAAAEARGKAAAQRAAVQAVWTGKWFRRAWLGPNLNWIGDDRIWLEPQPWAIIGGVTSPEQRETLVASIDRELRRPSPIGALILNIGEDTSSKRPGILENGGIWASINGTLIWALALAGGSSAWDEWKKNSLAMHAEAYPEIWYGIWSGPDYYNSVLSKHPGQTMFGDPPVNGKPSPTDWGVNWTDFPVMNMHPHAWPLYSAAKLLGVDFHEDGVNFAPALPLREYKFSSPLVGFSKSPEGFAGWYAPQASGNWTIEIRLPEAELAMLKQVKVNGVIEPLARGAKTIRFSGEGGHENALHWEVS
jgi:hypothetical protein